MRNLHYLKTAMVLVTIYLSISTLSAKIVLPDFFSDNMVLQQQTDAPIWGKATPKAAISVVTSWEKATYSTTADESGKWQITLKTPAAGGPYTISITENKKQTLTFKNVMIGEVWICSGQSNMEMPLAGWGKVLNYQREISSANYPNIRLLHVEKATSVQPQENVTTRGGWQVCSPKTVAEFSSVAYFFGRDLNENLNVPIGLISTSWGGTIAEAWTSSETLAQMPDFATSVAKMQGQTDAELKKQYENTLSDWNKMVLTADLGYKGTKPVFAEIEYNDAVWKRMNLPVYWEKAGLSGFDGIVWFRRNVAIPDEWFGQDLTLRLSKIDDDDITYFNGVEIGTTIGVSVERSYTIPAKLVKSGKNVITIRVTDTGGEGGVYGDERNMYIAPAKKYPENKLSLAGEWRYISTSDFSKISPHPASMDSPNRPTVLFNAMIKPLVPYAFQGAIWYQGESNADRAQQYRDLFPLMIRDWRKQWNRDFPFYFVQLANFMQQQSQPAESNWALLREAQTMTLRLANTGMAVAIDIGDADDIHPKNKQEVARRLALNARAKTYKENIVFSGSVYAGYTIEGDKIRIRFRNARSGLQTPYNEAIKGFSIAGPDHKFVWADAVIDGNDVLVSSPEIKFPVAVRYAWADNPDCNLYNAANLPTVPFRTDDY